MPKHLQNFNMIVTKGEGPESCDILTQHEAPPIGGFRKEVTKCKNMALDPQLYDFCRERHQHQGGTTRHMKLHLIWT